MTSIKFILSVCTMVLCIGIKTHAQQIELRYLGTTQNTAVYTSQQMMSVHLTSNAINELDIMMEFVVHNGQNELLAQLRSDIFQIKPNQSVIGPRFVGINGALNHVFSRPAFDRIARTNFNFPTGNYKICAYAKSIEGVVMGQTCFEISVQSPLSIHLIYPFDEQIVEEDFPVFSWTPVMLGAGQKVNYRIRWVESFGNVSKVDFNESPAFFIQEKLRTSYLPYTASFEDFDPSKTYYWRVQAVSNDRIITESEIWEFNFEMNRISKKSKGPFVKMEVGTKNNVVYVQGNQLKIEIDNPYSKVDLKYAIRGSKDTPVLSGTWAAEKESHAGRNYKSIELNNLIIPGRPYRLSVSMAGELLELFFVKN